MKVDFRASKETEVQVPIGKKDTDKCLDVNTSNQKWITWFLLEGFLVPKTWCNIFQKTDGSWSTRFVPSCPRWLTKYDCQDHLESWSRCQLLWQDHERTLSLLQTFLLEWCLTFSYKIQFELVNTVFLKYYWCLAKRINYEVQNGQFLFVVPPDPHL